MTQHQRNVTPIDPVKLDRLAEVAVKVGLQLAPGQDLLITAPRWRCLWCGGSPNMPTRRGRDW